MSRIGILSTCSIAVLVSVCLLFAACSGKKESQKASENLKIGAVFSVTGSAAKLGSPEKNAAEMLVAQINTAGGINGKMIELIVVDDQSAEANTQNAVKQLITRDNVAVIIGPSISGAGYAAAPICEESKVPLVSCAAAWTQLFPNKDVKQPMYKYVFKTPQNDSDCARKIYEDCKAKGYTKVALVTVTTGFGQAGQLELQNLAPKFGITIVADETYPKDATDLTPILTKIKSKNPQAIIHWSIEPVQGLIAGQVKSLKISAQLYQSHGFGNKKYITPEAEGVLFPAGRLLVMDDLDYSHTQYAILKKFKADYEAKYGEDVSTFAGHSYDALLLIQAAATAKGSDRAGIRDGLEGIANLVGTAGVYTMKADDHCGLTSEAFVMVTVKDGKFRLAEKVMKE